MPVPVKAASTVHWDSGGFRLTEKMPICFFLRRIIVKLFDSLFDNLGASRDVDQADRAEETAVANDADHSDGIIDV